MSTTLSDVINVEGEAESAEDYYSSMQRFINNGMAWRMQGFYGRSAMDALSEGRCCLGRSRTTDYWGNPIPGRDDVKDGTKGSLGFVRQQMGEDWATLIESIE